MASQINVKTRTASFPAIGLGTWALKGEQCAAAVAAALKCGYRHIDTAAMYDNEEAVGGGLKAGGVPRSEVWVTTKVWWDQIGDGALQRSAEASLKRLGLDHVDLLLIHWPNPAIPLAQSMRALADAKRRGLTRNIGVSNFPVALIEEAVRHSSEPIVANQCEYHPHLDQSKVLAACRRHDIGFVSYCPIGRGDTGGVITEPVIREMARAKGRTPAQIVLRWQVQQPGVAAVPRSGNAGRIAENFGVFDFSLSDDEIKRISALARPDGRIVNLSWAPKWD